MNLKGYILARMRIGSLKNPLEKREGLLSWNRWITGIFHLRDFLWRKFPSMRRKEDDKD